MVTMNGSASLFHENKGLRFISLEPDPGYAGV